MNVTAFSLAERYIGIREVPGSTSNPAILAMLRLDATWPEEDAVPWCSGFANWIAWHLRLPRSKSLSARSWLGVGQAVDLNDAQVGFDVVVLKRGTNAPGPDIINAPGHVGFYAGREGDFVLVLGGNQSDGVSVERFAIEKVLGVRRLA